MKITARRKYLRVSPRKMRLIADLIRGMEVSRAREQLAVLTKGGAVHIEKLLASAVANAQHNMKITKEGLFIREIKVDGGPVLKRYRPKAFGRANPIGKRTSHILVVLDSHAPVAATEAQENVERERNRRHAHTTRRGTGREGVARSQAKARIPARRFFQRKSV